MRARSSCAPLLAPRSRPASAFRRTPSRRAGEQQVRIFEDEGFDLNRVYIGHSNDSTDLEYLQGLLARGVWLGLDRHQTSLPIGPDWEGRAQTLAALIKAGHGDRLMVSHDWSVLGVSRTSDPLLSRTYNP